MRARDRSRTLGRHRHSSDPGLNLAFRHVPVTDNTAPARSVGQIGMGFAATSASIAWPSNCRAPARNISVSGSSENDSVDNKLN